MFKCEPVKSKIEEIIKKYDADDGLYELRIERVIKAIEAEFAKRCEGITPEFLHKSYLSAIAHLNGKDFNPMADRPYEDLTAGQKSIDKFIAAAIRTHLRGEK